MEGWFDSQLAALEPDERAALESVIPILRKLAATEQPSPPVVAIRPGARTPPDLSLRWIRASLTFRARHAVGRGPREARSVDHDVDVAVIGGGLGGLTLAIGLRKAGVPAEVFEQAAELREVGAGVAIGANSTRLLDRLGVHAAAVGNVPPDMQFRRWDDGELIWSHPVGDWYRERMGAPYVLLHRGTLRRVLAEAIPPEQVHTDHRLVGIEQEPGGVCLRFTGRADVLARIAVGVDGIHSAVREHVVGHAVPVLSGEIGFRGLIPVGRSPGMPAPTSIQFWCGPRTHVVAYGIDDGALINLLAVYVPDRPPAWTQTTSRVPGTSAEAHTLFRELGWDQRILGSSTTSAAT